jgi:microcystin-dependent protein
MNIKPGAGIIDKNGSAGTNGQVLASTGANSVEWSSGNSLPAGALMNFVQSTAPSGWLVANGDTVPNGTGTVQGVTANFSSLYAALGSSFGGPGKLPDMRGMFTRGWDSAGGAARNCDPGRALGSQQGFALQNITGSICGISETFGNTASPSSPTAGNALYRSASGPSCGLTPQSTDASNAGTMCFNASLSACTAAETRPVNIAILPCIKY